MVEIKHRFTARVIAAGETLVEAIRSAGANLTKADLSGAVLSGADLSGANLSGADLSGANLLGANLSSADLCGANLRRANLSGANLSGADLRRADLRGADLIDANLIAIKADVLSILDLCPAEVGGLRDAIASGRIDGSVYAGQCACLIGTIASLKSCEYTSIPGIRPDDARPAERWFLAIRPGDTPDKSQIVAITLGWVDEWLAANTK